MAADKNTTAQNITSLTYKINGINNSEKTISKAMTTLFQGIAQWGVFVGLASIQNSISNGDITLDTYVVFQPPVGNTFVDTPRHIFEVYA